MFHIFMAAAVAAAPVQLTPSQAIGIQTHADQAAGIIEWFIVGVSSLMGAGTLAGIGYMAWQSAKATRHLIGEAAALARTGLMAYSVAGGAAGVASSGAAAGAEKVAGGSAAGMTAEDFRANARHYRYATQGPDPGANTQWTREGAMGWTEGGNRFDLGGLRNAKDRSVENVHLNTGKIQANEFGGLAEKTAHGGSLHIETATGTHTFSRNTAGAFFDAKEPAGEARTAADLRNQFYPGASAGAKEARA